MKYYETLLLIFIKTSYFLVEENANFYAVFTTLLFISKRCIDIFVIGSGIRRQAPDSPHQESVSYRELQHDDATSPYILAFLHPRWFGH